MAGEEKKQGQFKGRIQYRFFIVLVGLFAIMKATSGWE
jgi:hypothetical protein